jgi:thiosulfate dehydrogenase (quinone) large subunit
LLGALILIGLRTRTALVGAGMLMAVLTFGVCLIQDFSAAGLQLTYAAVIAGLVALVRYDGWSVDAAMGVRGQVTAPDERVQVPFGNEG